MWKGIENRNSLTQHGGSSGISIERGDPNKWIEESPI